MSKKDAVEAIAAGSVGFDSTTLSSEAPPSRSNPPPMPSNPDIETIVFEQPICRGETVIREVNINKPKTGALRGLSLADVMKLEVDTIIKLTPRISTPTLVEHEVANLELVDLMKISTAVIGFFGTAEQRRKAREEAQNEKLEKNSSCPVT